MDKRLSVRFEMEGRQVTVKPGITIFEASKKAGVGIRSECGGKGLCGRCKVIIENESHLSSVCKNELKHIMPAELSRGFRLACCTEVEGNVVVFIPPESRIGARKIQVGGLERIAKLDPAIRKFHLLLSEPTLTDTRPDFERLTDSLPKEKLNQPEIDQELLNVLPNILRSAKWDITVTTWDNERIIAVERGNTENAEYGFSVDIGTSKIVGYLVDLVSGETVNVKSLENPQIRYGEDIISRINHVARSRKALRKLQEMTIEAINTLINDSCQYVGVNPRRIYEVTIVGNTAMHHFFLGIQPKYLALAPYVPTIRRSVDIKAGSLKIAVNPLANIHVLPVVAGFVGADAVADVLATGIYEMKEMCLLMDVGTNGEVFVGNRAGIVACSCAAGSAIEGMHIKYGMKAWTGAIERVKIDPDSYDVECETIDGVKPIGICGSGIIDAVSEMFRCGIINQRGAFNKNVRTRRFRDIGGGEFVITWKHETELCSDITINRRDIQEIQLAKAAMHTGAVILMKERKVMESELDHLYIAGAFGNYLYPESARLIGLIPDVPAEKIDFVGNSAIVGAKMALTSKQIRETAERLSKSIHYVELTTAPDFRKELLSSMFLPYREIEKYPRVMDYFQRQGCSFVRDN